LDLHENFNGDVHENFNTDVSLDKEIPTEFWKSFESALAEVCALRKFLCAMPQSSQVT